MTRGRHITRTNCIDCKCKLTDENRYKSVRSRCKTCHTAKVRGTDLTVPPQVRCVDCEQGTHRCMTCSAALTHGHSACETCTGAKPRENDGWNVRRWYIKRYKELGLEEYLPRVLAELDQANIR